ncbi:MAG: hypothetical protein JNL34_02765 [Anaerolineae bacterium]|nr:hypothetical protein [Anaerolineae bacterium]
MTRTGARIGFLCTRFFGTDGVALETARWAAVLEDIRPKGFRAITCGEFVDESAWQQVRDWLQDTALTAIR